MNEKKYKSVKIPEEAWENLKSISGDSLSRTISTIAKAVREAAEEQVNRIDNIARSILPELVKSGILQVKVSGFEITGVERGERKLKITGYVLLEGPEAIIDKLMEVFEDVRRTTKEVQKEA